MQLRPGAPHNAIEEEPFFLASEIPGFAGRPYVATCHVRMWRAPKSLQLSVDDLEPVGDIPFLSPIGLWISPEESPCRLTTGVFHRPIGILKRRQNGRIFGVDDRDLTWIQPLICLEGRWALLCSGWWWSLGCVGQPSTTFGEMELDRV